MKATLHPSPTLLAVLLCIVLSLASNYTIAQNTTSTGMDNNVLYYLFGGAIILVIIAIIFVLRKVARVAGEYGLSLFDLDFPIFKRMAESKGMVAVVMILLILWGIYLVVTYKVN
jgi:LPXTG-motif cell wall-anchored protein